MLSLGEVKDLLGEYGALRLVILSAMVLLSSIIGTSAYGVEKGYYGKSRFIFKLKKNFEDVILEGKKNLYLYVEVVEITPDGIERRRPDLTRNVEVYSEDDAIELGYTLMNGYYAETSIGLRGGWVEENARHTNVIVSYRGKEGVFKNIIEFKIQLRKS